MMSRGSSWGLSSPPPQETGTAGYRVETVLGYAARTPDGVLLLDTGLGEAGQETEEWYRPRRAGIEGALRTTGLTVQDIDLVVNCHLHFDHIGGNPVFAGRPIFCQRRELETARTTEYTVPGLVDFTGVRYELGRPTSWPPGPRSSGMSHPSPSRAPGWTGFSSSTPNGSSSRTTTPPGLLDRTSFYAAGSALSAVPVWLTVPPAGQAIA
jgi:hypothetical protein